MLARFYSIQYSDILRFILCDIRTFTRVIHLFRMINIKYGL